MGLRALEHEHLHPVFIVSTIYKGERIARRVSYEYLPDEGFFWVYYMDGTPKDIYSEAATLTSIGYDVWTSRSGPYVRLTARRNRSSAFGNQIDRWTVSSEILEKDLFSMPEAITEMSAFTAGRAYYQRGIRNALKDESNLDTQFSAGTTPIAYKILEELRRGVEVFEHEYTILTRTRTFDRLNPFSLPENLQLNSNRTVYTTAQLQAVESIPPDVLFTLPTDPSTNPEQTLWGWRIREQQAEITSSTTGVHRTSWVYAAWSTFLYTPYTP